jgi:hypothetical protein
MITIKTKLAKDSITAEKRYLAGISNLLTEDLARKYEAACKDLKCNEHPKEESIITIRSQLNKFPEVAYKTCCNDFNLSVRKIKI